MERFYFETPGIERKETFDSITGLSPTVAVEQRIIR